MGCIFLFVFRLTMQNKHIHYVTQEKAVCAFNVAGILVTVLKYLMIPPLLQSTQYNIL